MVILQTYAAVPISCKNSGAKSAPFAHSIVVCVDPYWMNLSLSNNSPNTSPVRYGFKSTFKIDAYVTSSRCRLYQRL